VLLSLDEVFDGDESGQTSVPVDDGQLLNLIAPQETERRICGDTLLSGDQR
jgi:hypothetical protein